MSWKGNLHQLPGHEYCMIWLDSLEDLVRRAGARLASSMWWTRVLGERIGVTDRVHHLDMAVKLSVKPALD